MYLISTHSGLKKVEKTLKSKLVRGFAVSAGAAVFILLAAFLGSKLFPSPKEMQLRREMDKMREEYGMFNDELKKCYAALENVRARDRDMYRLMLDLKPIDDNVWNAGTGGSETFDSYMNLSDADMLRKTKEKIAKLKYQLSLQTKSHDELIEAYQKKEDRLVSIPSIKPLREDKLNKSMQLLSGFGMRIHPILHIAKMHMGIDFGAPQGTPIYATGKGTVVRIEYKNSGYGHSVVISHGYGYETLYGHMDKILVTPGQQLFKGQQIGTVGSSGTSTAPHCHYEVIKDGTKAQPHALLLGRPYPQRIPRVRGKCLPHHAFV